MKRGRFVHLAMLAGMMAVTAGAAPLARAAGLPDTPLRVQAFPGTGAVLITYGGVQNATGYNVYRRAASETADAAVKVNAQPTPFTWLIDDGQGQGLANGTAYLYSVKAVLPGGAEGPASREVVVTPQVPILGGFFAHDIGTPFPSSVTLDGNTLTVRASGSELWDLHDEGTFIGLPVAGDYSISVKVLEKLEGGHPTGARAGVMIREGLGQGDRFADTSIGGRGVLFVARTTIYGAEPGNVFFVGTNNDETTYPVWVRLTKEGAVISSFQSYDGTNWDPVGEPADFGRMQPETYAGLLVTAVHSGNADRRYVTARFDASTLKIE